MSLTFGKAGVLHKQMSRLLKLESGVNPDAPIGTGAGLTTSQFVEHLQAGLIKPQPQTLKGAVAATPIDAKNKAAQEALVGGLFGVRKPDGPTAAPNPTATAFKNAQEEYMRSRSK